MVQEQEGQALVFSYDYKAGATFDVVSQLETGTTVRLLQAAEGESVPEISQPDEYNGYVIREQTQNGPLAPTTVLFVRGQTFSSGDTATLGEDASMFSSQLNLLSTTLE